jgi:chromate reductase
MGKSVLGIAGSLRRGSYNRLLLAAAVQRAPAGATVHVYEELGSIPPFNEDLESEAGEGQDALRRLRREVAAADGLLIATPEYNWSIPGVLKNAIDWLSRPGPDEILAGKPIAVVGASAGRWGTRLAQNALRQVLTSTECLLLPGPNLFAREAAGLFDQAGRLIDESTREQLDALLAAFVDWIDRVAGGEALRSPRAGR